MSKVSIVTVAGRGIGAAIAKVLAAEGFTPALLSPGETVEGLGASLGGFGLRGSVTEAADLEKLVAEISSKGPLGGWPVLTTTASMRPWSRPPVSPDRPPPSRCP